MVSCGGRGILGRCSRRWGLPARHPWGDCPFKHEPYHPGSPTPSVHLAPPAGCRVLETFLELIQQPSCKVVLGTALLLGGGGLLLWIQRKRRRKMPPESAQGEHESSECHGTKNEDWIKSYFTCLSEEKLAACSNISAAGSSAIVALAESGRGQAGSTVHRETFAMKQEGGTAFHQESFTSKQRVSGSSGPKETHKESGRASSTDEATWATVAACAKEIDTKGQHLANSMLQYATAYQNSGHLESKDINQEELKALEEVEMKLKGNFLSQRETTIAGVHYTHNFPGHGHQSHQGYPSHPSHQSHSLPSHSHQPYHPFEAK
nr:uncharacterized protein C10orf62 homolog [Manis javanica]